MADDDKYQQAGRHALWGLSHSRHFMGEFSDAIKPETFGSQQERIFTAWCLDHWKKFDEIITDSALEAYMDSDADFEALDLTPRTIDRIIESMEEIARPDRKRIYADIHELIKRRAFVEAREEADRLLAEDDLDAAFDVLEKARKDQPRKSKVMGYVFPFDSRKVGHASGVGNTISSGLLKLDECLDGGIGRGEVAIYVGASGSGKSQWLCFEAAQATLHGIDCVFYTLELSPEEVYRRIEASATGLTIDEIKKADGEEGNDPELKPLRDKVAEARSMLQRRRKRAGLSEYLAVVRDLTEEPPSLQTILDDLDNLEREGIKPALVIIDYADLLIPHGSYRSDHEGQSEIHKELARIAKSRDIAIWTASQVGREGVTINKNMSPLTLLKTIQGAFAKIFTATFVVWGAQTAATRKRNESLFLIAKARRGGHSGDHFYVRWDYSRAYFRSAQEDDDASRDGGFTRANEYERDSIYDDPFNNTEREDYDENEGRRGRRE